MIITIDGPSGVGKSSHSSHLARHLGFGQIDSGALYRAMTLHCLRAGVDFDSVAALERAAAEARLELELTDVGQVVRLGGVAVDEELRDPEVSRRIGNVADSVPVRQRINAIMRAATHGRHMVMDGRDMGTVVFPDAEIKIFLDADADERGRRRYEQLLKDRGPGAVESLEEVVADLRERDRRDRSREFGGLRQADGALLVDSTGLSFPQTQEKLRRAVESHPAYLALLSER